ncbi:YgdI/YgdR family lipoprotein [Clostridium beijerinckii]|nr:YgdI/YgdR family lipoprotein [Clostridium beijerinckii]NRT74394.1 preprotein translocase subunit SecG [Clostridium beijerinckii]
MKKFINIVICFLLIFMVLLTTGCETQYLGGIETKNGRRI